VVTKMVAPVTGPVTQYLDTPMQFINRQRRKQKRPYNLELPYSAQIGGTTSMTGFTNPTYLLANKPFSTGPSGSYWLDKLVPQAQQIAYSRLIGAISDRASMGENLGQLGSSVRLIVDKAKIVADAVRRLRRFDVSAFAAWMDKGFVKRNSRFASQLTLELNFAIIPSINDIFSAVEILQNPIKSARVRGRATEPLSASYNTTAGFTRTWTMYGKVSAEYGARVAISNPNLYLANAMGLINPVQIAWQLLPGSFLVDWFIPVEQFLGTATDFLGLRVESSYTSWFARGNYSEYWTTYGWKGTVVFAETERAAGINLPSLTLRPLKIPSLKRAANAVSLAIQAFHK
jgi:hypothetical protein